MMNNSHKDSQLLRKLVTKILSYAKEYKGLLIIIGILLLFSNGFGLGFPLLVKKIVDIILVENADRIVLTWWCIGGVLCVSCKGIVEYTLSILNSYVSQKLTIDIREDFFAHLMRLPLSFFDNRHTGDISSRAFNDIGQLQGTIIFGTLYFIKDILFLIGLMVIIFLTSWKAFLLFIGGTIFVGVFTEGIRRKTRQISSLLQEKRAFINTHFLEAISLIKEIKLFLHQKKITTKFSNMNREYLEVLMKDTKLHSSTGPVSDIVFTITMLSIVWLAGVMEKGLTPGSVVSLFIYLQYVFGPVMGIIGFTISLQRVLACGERVFEILSVKPEIQDSQTKIDIQPETKWDIKFKDIVLKYNGKEVPAINGVNLEIEDGEIIALVGPNGSGKTSLARLLLRLYNPTLGSIHIDGIDINKINLTSLRERIGIIPQDPVLFHGTVYENIAFGKGEASLEEIIRVSKTSMVDEIITRLPDTYNTVIGERGIKLSGGERQCIAIARTLLKNPELLILDEATSYLDPKKEVEICEAIMKLRKGRTTIIITHRPIAVIKAERIVVMNKGQIKEKGRFQELFNKKGSFYKLFQNQLKNLNIDKKQPG
ncbi:MAG: ABC transporter ATP-binding protein [bacterium]